MGQTAPQPRQPDNSQSAAQPSAMPRLAQDNNGDGQIDQEELRQSALNAYQNWVTPKITAERRIYSRLRLL